MCAQTSCEKHALPLPLTFPVQLLRLDPQAQCNTPFPLHSPLVTMETRVSLMWAEPGNMSGGHEAESQRLCRWVQMCGEKEVHRSRSCWKDTVLPPPFLSPLLSILALDKFLYSPLGCSGGYFCVTLGLTLTVGHSLSGPALEGDTMSPPPGLVP